MVFAGLVAMMDPPREEAKVAVETCHRAGIRPVMITGDHAATALAVARELNITADAEHVLAGTELESLADTQLAARADSIAVYARVTAEHKMRVVRALRSRGQVVAMTGDGVNDAPALKAADVGIAMGITGTDVTKEASDVVLADDNFASIVNAVEQGRCVYDNVRKFVHYLLATNAGEVLLMLGAALAGWPIPLTAIQILWINLVTDGLPALALGVEPPEPDLMSRPPRRGSEPVIGGWRGLQMLVHGALIAAAGAFAFDMTYRAAPANLHAARTNAFCVMAYSQLFYAFTCRSRRYHAFQLGLRSNPQLLWAIAASAALQAALILWPYSARALDAVSAPATVAAWARIIGLSLLPATAVEVAKIARAWFVGHLLKRIP
jgi:Ca2+-transporting ATPase